MSPDPSPPRDPAELRQKVMAACAHASDDELDQAVTACGIAGTIRTVRAPETGLVMLRGRMGGDGARFNVGEATVTRAVVALETGETGFSYLLGRSKSRARHAAILDAVAQMLGSADMLTQHLIAPIAQRRRAEREARSAATQATRVNFFTLVRGED